MVSDENTSIRRNRLELGKHLLLRIENVRGNLLTTAGPVLAVIDGQPGTHLLGNGGHSAHIQPEVWVFVAVIVVGRFIVAFFLGVLVFRVVTGECERINPLRHAPDGSPVGLDLIQHGLEAFLEQQPVRDNHVSSHHRGHLFRGGLEVVRVGANRQEDPNLFP